MSEYGKRVFTNTTRLALLLRIEGYVQDNGEMPSVSLMGRWFNVTYNAIQRQIPFLIDADWLQEDARTGKLLWQRYLGGHAIAGPMSYAINGRQHVAMAVGHSLFVFALPRAEQ